MTLFYLLGSILSSTIINLIFKVFEQKNVDTFQAIVINYFICVAIGSLLIGEVPVQSDFWQTDWFLGILFISTFYAMALTVQYFGVAIAVVLQKMSVVISVIFAIWMYQESVNAVKIGGIILALIAVVLTNIQDKSASESRTSRHWWLVLLLPLVFFSCGAIECLLQYAQMSVMGGEGGIRFAIFLFGTAGAIGGVTLLGSIIAGKSQLSLKNFIGGVALGIPNYFSLYFLLKVLGSGWEGSMIFPVNNIGIIVAAAVAAWILFKEKLLPVNVAGIIVAVISIILIAISS